MTSHSEEPCQECGEPVVHYRLCDECYERETEELEREDKAFLASVRYEWVMAM